MDPLSSNPLFHFGSIPTSERQVQLPVEPSRIYNVHVPVSAPNMNGSLTINQCVCSSTSKNFIACTRSMSPLQLIHGNLLADVQGRYHYMPVAIYNVHPVSAPNLVVQSRQFGCLTTGSTSTFCTRSVYHVWQLTLS